VHKELPGTQILPGMAHHGALVHHGKHRHLPLSKNERRTTVDCASADTSRDIATNRPRPIIRPSTKRRPGVAVQIHPAGAHAQATASRAFRSLGDIRPFFGFTRIYDWARCRRAPEGVLLVSAKLLPRAAASALGEATGDGEVGASSCAAASSPCAICRSRPTAAGASS
jgi:hypothetical protein